MLMNFKNLFWFLIVNLSIGLAFGQSGQVLGVVSDQNGQYLEGVTVLEEGTNNGTFTLDDGSYELTASGSEAYLVFSFIGYTSERIQVKDQQVINVTLREDILTTDEVIVIGYGTQKRSEISGAVSTITADEITQGPVLRVEQALQGRAAGVQVTQNSGSPGSPLSIRIRGIGTINNSDPIFVVDGVIVGGLDYLNPADIETISVLKDAASAAIYGTNGANGVVLITTKQGKEGQRATINYDGYTGTQSAWRQMDLLNAEQYGILNNEARIAAGIVPRAELLDPSTLGEGTDWQGAIFTDAPISSHQIGITGGTDASVYALSGSYFKQGGIVGGDKSAFDRITMRSNITNNVSKKIKVGTNINFTHLERSALPENNEFSTPLVRALNIDPVTKIQDENGNYQPSMFLDTDIFNPVNQINNTYNNWQSDRILGTIFGEAEPITGLKLRSSFTLDLTHANSSNFSPKDSLSINDQTPISSVSREHLKWRNWQWDNTITYEWLPNDNHNFFFLLGSSARDEQFENVGGFRTDLRFNDVQYAYLNNGNINIENQTSFGGISQQSLLSFFGRISYDYQEKYLLLVNFRRDGSSKFGPNNRFGLFPSISGAWVLSKEKFMEKYEQFSFLKVRASWGRNGNQASVPNFQYLSIIEQGAWGRNGAMGSYSYVFGPNQVISTGAAPTVRPNPDIAWEISEQFDVGLDVGLWNEQLYFTVDYYRKNTKGMLIALPTQGHVGAIDAFVNAASARNEGLELSGEIRKKVRRFYFTLGGNMGIVKNELTALGNGGTPIFSGFLQQANNFLSYSDVGLPIASFYGYETAGVFQDQEEIASHAFQREGTAPGDLKFVDQNNDGVINDDDRTVIGNPTPDFTYGVNGSLTVRNFDLNFFGTGVYGNEIYKGFNRLDFEDVNLPANRLNRWTGPGTSNVEPRMVAGDPNQNARVSDYYIEDGSFFRIKVLQLGYTLPQNILVNARVQKVRVYFTANNLVTFTNYSGLDPEIGTRGTLEIGIDRGFYPQSRSFLAGINITL